MSEAEKGRALEYTIDKYKTIGSDLASLRMELGRYADAFSYLTEFLRQRVDGDQRIDFSDYPDPARVIAIIDQIRDLSNEQDELHGQIKAKGVSPD